MKLVIAGAEKTRSSVWWAKTSAPKRRGAKLRSAGDPKQIKSTKEKAEHPKVEQRDERGQGSKVGMETIKRLKPGCSIRGKRSPKGPPVY